MNKCVGVIGGTGFVGRNLSEVLAANAIDHVCVSRRTGFDAAHAESVRCWIDRFGITHIINLAAECGGIGLNKRRPADLWAASTQINLGVLRAVASAHTPHTPIKLVMVGTVCFANDPVVASDRGPVRLSDIGVGDGVVAASGQLATVLDVMSRQYTGPILSIKVPGLPGVDVTPEHPFLSERGWVEADQLRPRDRLIVPISRPTTETTMVELLSTADQRKYVAYYLREKVGATELSRQTNVPRATIRHWLYRGARPVCVDVPSPAVGLVGDLAWLIGAFVADGWVCLKPTGKRGSRHYVEFAVGYDLDFADKIDMAFLAIWGKKLRRRLTEYGWVLTIGHKHAATFFGCCYSSSIHNASTKQLPDIITSASDRAIADCLDGYWAGDGCLTEVKRQPVAVGTTVSWRLANQISSLLRRLGLHNGIYRKPGGETKIEDRVVHHREAWQIRLVGKWAARFAATIMRIHIPYVGRDRCDDPRFCISHWVYQIKSIGRSEFSGIVRNLSVLGEESYTANGLAVHNCSYARDCPPPFKETDLMCHGEPESTNAAYGVAKLAALYGARAYQKQYGLDITNLVPVNMYGPWDHFDLENSHVVPAMIRKIDLAQKTNEPLVLWGTGNATREFLYAPDFAKAVLATFDTPSDPEFINVGTGKEIRIKKLVQTIAALMDYTGEIHWDVTMPDGQPRRYLDVSRAKLKLGWEATTQLTDGLSATIDWYRRHVQA